MISLSLFTMYSVHSIMKRRFFSNFNSPWSLIMSQNSKDKRMIILYVVPISLWSMLGKENCFFYTRQSNNNDRCKIRRFLKKNFQCPNPLLGPVSVGDGQYHSFTHLKGAMTHVFSNIWEQVSMFLNCVI